MDLKSLIEAAKALKGRLLLAAILFIGVLAGFGYAFSHGSFDRLLENARLTGNQVFVLIAGIASAVFVIIILLIFQDYFRRGRATPASEFELNVIVHQPKSKTAILSGAKVTLILSKTQVALTNDRGVASFSVPKFFIGKTVILNASCPGYAERPDLHHLIRADGQPVYIELQPEEKPAEPSLPTEKSSPQEGQGSTDPGALRLSYLNTVFTATSQLSLSGIDRKTASESDPQLNLSAVYTALLTQSPVESGDRARREEMPTDRRQSALEQLNRRDRLVLQGDPGSGKSTFVNFVAMCLAGESLGRTDIGLELLRSPLPKEEESTSGQKKKPELQPWEHGALLPVRVILRDFAARGSLPPPGSPATVEHLWAFLGEELAAAGLGEYTAHLRRELLEQGGLLLVDGLDEVPEADRRRVQVKQVVEGFAAAFPKCRILVTSRTYAYQQQNWRLAGFNEAVLAPFNRPQIRQFIERWYAHIAALRNLNSQEAQGRAELLKRAVFGSDRLLGLAERPLLLTLIASLHAWRSGNLPEKREELYHETVDLLLDWWERAKQVRDKEGKLVLSQPSLIEYLKTEREKMHSLLNQLAFQAHSAQSGLTGTADVPEQALVSGLMELSKNPKANPHELIDYLSQRAGLLIPRGVGVYTFPHRTFQEYLAARHLTDHGYPEEVARLVSQQPQRWREVGLLAAAKAVRGGAFALWPLVEALCCCEPDFRNNFIGLRCSLSLLS